MGSRLPQWDALTLISLDVQSKTTRSVGNHSVIDHALLMDEVNYGKSGFAIIRVGQEQVGRFYFIMSHYWASRNSSALTPDSSQVTPRLRLSQLLRSLPKTI